MPKRCRWCNPKNERYIAYHDREWGVLSTDEGYLYEMLLLECQQAGLSWERILDKRDAYREAFDGFDPVRIAAYDEDEIARLRRNGGIVRCERKIRATVRNAQIYLDIVKEYGSFFRYLTSFLESYPIYETDKTTSALSDTLSRDLKRRGMTYVGSLTVYSYLQAVGLIISHERDCFLYHGNERTFIWNSPTSN